ncbi:MAG: AMP-binding protein [Actinomycetota bacterium]|nr:AMP-binding protein [Actinomycetota bacterium]
MITGQLTLRELLINAVDRFADLPAVTSNGVTVSYGRLISQANGLASFLQRSGVSAGTPVALMMTNGLEYVIADQALLRAGGAKVPLNDLLNAGDADHILRDSGAVVAVATPSQLANAIPALSDPSAPLATLVVVGPMPERPVPGMVAWADAVGDGTPAPPVVEVAASDVGMIVYTGGTTGVPKGVVHSQAGLATNILSHLIEIGFGDDERLLITSPLPHSAGFHLQAGMVKGAHVFVESGFSPDDVLDRIETDRVTFLFAVPTMIYRLLDHVRQASAHRELDLSSLRTILYGAAPITTDRLTEGLRRFGPVFMQLYGQTEAPNFITRLTRTDHDPARPERLTSCGRPAALTQVRIVDAHGGECAVGDIGEVTALTPYTLMRYHRLPEKTAETIRDGWLYTGDLGRVDADGYVYLVDRKNDMIITGGMNVYSSEVENTITTLDHIAQAAVVGAPHPDWGEEVVAFVVPTPEFEVDPAAVIEHCRTRLSRYKIPKRVLLVDSLPTTALGKFDKKALRNAALDAVE